MKIIKQIQKVKRWKCTINGFTVVLLMNNGLVDRVISSKKLTKLIKGWNIFSVIRFLYENSVSLKIYKWKNSWMRLNISQLYEIIIKGIMK